MLTNPESPQVQIARFEQQLVEVIEQTHKLTTRRVQLQQRLIDLERKHERLVKQQFHLKEIIARLREQERSGKELHFSPGLPPLDPAESNVHSL